MKYKTMYADPPWMERGAGKIKRGADRHYPLMSTEDIIALRPLVDSLMDDDSHLYLWVTNNFLEDGLRVMRAWGYEYITVITWFKDRAGLGQYYRGITESCLFGRRGKLPYKIVEDKRQQGLTGFYAPRGEHSEKPDYMRKQIEKVSYGPYIEMFARQAAPGWDCIGNEIGERKDLGQIKLDP